jgi:hypothetical protein
MYDIWYNTPEFPRGWKLFISDFPGHSLADRVAQQLEAEKFAYETCVVPAGEDVDYYI